MARYQEPTEYGDKSSATGMRVRSDSITKRSKTDTVTSSARPSQYQSQAQRNLTQSKEYLNQCLQVQGVKKTRHGNLKNNMINMVDIVNQEYQIKSRRTRALPKEHSLSSRKISILVEKQNQLPTGIESDRKRQSEQIKANLK